MVDECPMTEECPGYDRDRRSCLVHPDDCEFSPANDETALRSEAPEGSSPEDRLVRVDVGSPRLAPGGRDGVRGQASQRHQAAPHRGV
jgi:hypothetical protein